MERLVDNLIEGIRNSKEYLKYYFIIGAILFLFSVSQSFKVNNGDFASALVNNGFYILGIMFILWLLKMTEEGEEAKKIKYFKKVKKILQDLQEEFPDIEAFSIDEKPNYWKKVFKIKNNVEILVTIDDENMIIRNFFLSFPKNIIEQEKINKKSDISETEWNSWYGDAKHHIVYQETLNMCMNKKYEEAINFLLDILEEAKLYKKNDSELSKK